PRRPGDAASAAHPPPEAPPRPAPLADRGPVLPPRSLPVPLRTADRSPANGGSAAGSAGRATPIHVSTNGCACVIRPISARPVTLRQALQPAEGVVNDLAAGDLVAGLGVQRVDAAVVHFEVLLAPLPHSGWLGRHGVVTLAQERQDLDAG